MKKTLLFLPLLACLALTALAARRSEKAVEKINDFRLTDPRDGKACALSDFKDKKAVVVFLLGTECPINNAYMPRLSELHKEFSPRGVQFLAVYPNQQDTAEEVAAHAKKNDLPFPALKDDNQKVADLLHAERTPEALVLSPDGKVLYKGRIDDQYGIGYLKPKPTSREVATVLGEVLSGNGKISVASVPASGCLIGRPVKPKPEGAVTYAKQVSRIMQKHCQECHRAGQIGPMALMTYDDVSNWSAMIKEVVSERRMPPWHADPKHGKFSNDRSLPAEEREALLAWIDQGCPKGDDKDLPPARAFLGKDGWRIGKPDAVFTMPEAFDVPAEMPARGIPYKYFEIETNFKEDRWCVMAEARPDATEVVHHIIVYVVPPGQRFMKGNGDAVLCGTAPGDMPLILPEGMARKIPAGSKLIMQMHYTPNGRAVKDRSSVGLIFSKVPPKRSVPVFPIANVILRIPAGAENHEVKATFTFPKDGQIVGFMPHMHLRGKDFLIEAQFPDGKKEILLSIPKYDFGWQSSYRCAKPIDAPKGTRILCMAHFDNSTKNPNNPDATKEVRWGDQTWEEMMIGWMDFCFNEDAK